MDGVREALACGRQITVIKGVAGLQKAVFRIFGPFPISGMGVARNLKFGEWMSHTKITTKVSVAQVT